MSESVGKGPTIRIGAYNNGGAIYSAMDVFTNVGLGDMCITIGWSKNVLLLPNQFDSQMDLELPGVIDCLRLLSVIKEKTQGQISITTDL